MKIMRKPEKRDWINIIVILILLGFFIWIGVEYTKKFGEIQGDDMISSAENLREFILSYGDAGIAVIISLNIFHVVVSFIPGALVQFCGGMIYGMAIAMITGVIGTAIGTAISFYLARYLGRRIVTLFVSEKTLNKVEVILAKNTSSAILFLLFIIPCPKDIFAYLLGPTNIKASKFFIISAVGRLPGMYVSAYLGAHIFDRNYVMLISVTAMCVIFSVLLYFFKDKILDFFSKKK